MKHHVLIFLGLVPNPAMALNPEVDCIPAMKDVDWGQVDKFGINLMNLSERINDKLNWLPDHPEPIVGGSLKFITDKKTGCCDPSSTEKKTLYKKKIEGTGTLGINTGNLVILGAGFPGVAGVFVTASFSAEISLDGSLETNCHSDGAKFCGEGQLSFPIELGGGVQVFGDAIEGKIVREAAISSGLRWCEGDKSVSPTGLKVKAKLYV